MGGHEREESPGRSRSERRVGVRLCKDVLASRRGRQRYARATTASSPGPGTLRLSRSSWRLPVAHPAAARRYAVRSDHAGTRPAAPGTGVRPQIPGFSPGGLGPHLTASGFPSGLSSGFPFAHPGLFPFVRLPPVSLRPALSGSVPSAVAVRFGSPSVSLRVPFPLSNLHVSAAARRFCGRWSRAAGTKVTSSRRDPWPRSRRSARNAESPGADRVARRGGPAASPPTLRIS